MSKPWTRGEVEILQEMWGQKSIPAISKRLDRSIAGVKLKASRLQLGAHIDGGDLVSFHQLLLAIGLGNSYSYIKMRLIRDGFPIKRKRIHDDYFLMVSIDEFWRWAKRNKEKISFSKFAENALGAEPEWAKEKRSVDSKNATRFKTSKWSKSEDEHLKYLLGQFKYSYLQISQKLQRTEGAIKRRMITLGIKDRPIRQGVKFWDEKDIATLLHLREHGYSFEHIGETLGRTGSACRGKHEVLIAKEQSVGQ